MEVSELPGARQSAKSCKHGEFKWAISKISGIGSLIPLTPRDSVYLGHTESEFLLLQVSQN